MCRFFYYFGQDVDSLVSNIESLSELGIATHGILMKEPHPFEICPLNDATLSLAQRDIASGTPFPGWPIKSV